MSTFLSSISIKISYVYQPYIPEWSEFRGLHFHENIPILTHQISILSSYQ